MAWHKSGVKPLSEPMMAYLTDAYIRLGLNDLMKGTEDIEKLYKKSSIFAS